MIQVDGLTFLDNNFPAFASREHVDVWSASVNNFRDRLVALGNLLSSEERIKSAQFIHSEHRERYTLEHGIRRVVLGHYLKQKPATIEFSYGPSGKPEINRAFDRRPLTLSNAGTEDLTLLAITADGPVGIDVERLRDFPHLNEIAVRYFSHREKLLLANLYSSMRTHYFFRLWIAKEAVLKATGEGIGRNLENVEVFMDDDTSARAHATDHRNPYVKWQIQYLSPLPGYMASIAMPEGSYTVCHRRLVPSSSSRRQRREDIQNQ